MIAIDINHWLNIKWLYMSLGEKPVPIFKGYINALTSQIINNLDLTTEN